MTGLVLYLECGIHRPPQTATLTETVDSVAISKECFSWKRFCHVVRYVLSINHKMVTDDVVVSQILKVSDLGAHMFRFRSS